MTYEQARAYMREAGRRGSVFGLDGIRSLMAELEDVQETLSVIHIAGTNGKGSVGTFLSYAFMEAGYRVGRYTSPAVFSPLEIWQVNGVCMTKEEYAQICSQVKEACDSLVSQKKSMPTVFEMETAMAFLYFYRKKCDYVLLETGMGGSMDATNLIQKPLCAVITSISMDHMQFLGDSLSEIAEQKAGIIKKRCPVVTVCQDEAAMAVLERKAAEQDAALFVADEKQVQILADGIEEIRYRCLLNCIEQPPVYHTEERCRAADDAEFAEVSISLAGRFQVENSLLAFTVLHRIFHISVENIKTGFKKAVWPGRFEILMREPLFIIDGAHNVGAAQKLQQTIQNYFTNRKITYIIGVLADKEYEKIIKLLLPYASRVYTVTPPNNRALSGETLKEAAETILAREGQMRPAVFACETVRRAARLALDAAQERSEVILAFGSLSYLGEIRQYVKWRMACHDRQGKDKAGCAAFDRGNR